MNKRFLVAVAVLSVLAAGCELRADLRLELNPDESGRVLIVLGLDEEFQALVESGGDSVEDSLLGPDNPFGELPGGDQRTYTEDEFTYYESSFAFSDLNGLRALNAGAAPGENPLEEFNIAFTDDTARVSGSLDIGELTGGDLADDELGTIGADALAEIFKFTVQIDMPGKLKSHNADRVLDDGSLAWDIPLTGNVQTVSISAESSLSDGGGFPVWLIILIVVVLGAALLFLVAQSRRRQPPAPVEVPTDDTPTVTEVAPTEEPLPPPPPTTEA